MNLLLSSEELSKFATSLEEWNRKALEYVLNNYSPRDALTRFQDRATDQIWHLFRQFEEKNPKPDWRTLL